MVRNFLVGILTIAGSIVALLVTAPFASAEVPSLIERSAAVPATQATSTAPLELTAETTDFIEVALALQDRGRPNRPTTRPSPQRPGQFRPGVPRPRPVYRPYRPVRPIIIPVPVDPYYRGRYESRGQCRSWARSCDRGYRYSCRRYDRSCSSSYRSSSSCRRSFEDCEDGVRSACRSYRRSCLD